MEYINIVNWGKFQHYKDRRPTWIKLLIDIIDRFDSDGKPKKFHPLPDSAKLTFVMLLCLRANYNKAIPYPDKKWLKKRLGINTINLQPLVEAGFIAIDTEMVQGDTEAIQSCPKVLPPDKDKDKKRESDILKTKEAILDFSLTKEFFQNLFDEYFKPETQYEINTFRKLAKKNYDYAKKNQLQHHGTWVIETLADAKEYCKVNKKNRTDLIKIATANINKGMKP